jgi:NAD(P)-dependent dehydrogenase (short-subunit alcohol dehydrogenase family)
MPDRSCSCPGLVNTEIFDHVPADIRTGMFKTFQEKLPVGHIGTPDEVAEAYIFAMKVSRILGLRL